MTQEELPDRIRKLLGRENLDRGARDFINPRELSLSTVVQLIVRNEIDLERIDDALAKYPDPSPNPQAPDPASTQVHLANLRGRLSRDLERLYDELKRKETHYRSS